MIKENWRCTLRVWSSKVVEALRGHDCANLEAIIEPPWGYTWMWWVVLAMVPSYTAAVQVWNRTGCSSLGCYPENRGTHWVRGRVGTGPRFHITVPATWLQLNIWVLIVSWHDQYVDCAVLPPLSPPAVRFAIGPIFVESLWKKVIFRPKSAGFR